LFVQTLGVDLAALETRNLGRDQRRSVFEILRAAEVMKRDPNL
jgi:hypothetical protein